MAKKGERANRIVVGLAFVFMAALLLWFAPVTRLECRRDAAGAPASCRASAAVLGIVPFEDVTVAAMREIAVEAEFVKSRGRASVVHAVAFRGAAQELYPWGLRRRPDHKLGPLVAPLQAFVQSGQPGQSGPFRYYDPLPNAIGLGILTLGLLALWPARRRL